MSPFYLKFLNLDEDSTKASYVLVVEMRFTAKTRFAGVDGAEANKRAPLCIARVVEIALAICKLDGWSEGLLDRWSASALRTKTRIRVLEKRNYSEWRNRAWRVSEVAEGECRERDQLFGREAKLGCRTGAGLFGARVSGVVFGDAERVRVLEGRCNIYESSVGGSGRLGRIDRFAWMANNWSGSKELAREERERGRRAAGMDRRLVIEGIGVLTREIRLCGTEHGRGRSEDRWNERNAA